VTIFCSQEPSVYSSPISGNVHETAVQSLPHPAPDASSNSTSNSVDYIYDSADLDHSTLSSTVDSLINSTNSSTIGVSSRDAEIIWIIWRQHR